VLLLVLLELRGDLGQRLDDLCEIFTDGLQRLEETISRGLCREDETAVGRDADVYSTSGGHGRRALALCMDPV
jgi:hypothetical protein